MTVTYYVLKVLKNWFIDQIKPIQFDVKVVNWDFNDYLRGVNAYELLRVEPRGLMFINHTCITFSESYTGKNSEDLGMKLLKTMVDKT